MALVLVGYLCLGAFAVMVFSGVNRWFTAGAVAMGGCWLIDRILLGDGGQQLRDGAEAERWTSHELRKLRKSGWRHHDHVLFGNVDVDHVLFGPDGVVAIETKRTSADVMLEGRRLKGAFGNPIGRTIDGAQRIAKLLRAHGIDIPVHPALVMWGPNVAKAETTTLVAGVIFLSRNGAREWKERLPIGSKHIQKNALVRIDEVLRQQMAATSPRSAVSAPSRTSLGCSSPRSALTP